ncbi:DsbA family protein [Luedemannella flava]
MRKGKAAIAGARSPARWPLIVGGVVIVGLLVAIVATLVVSANKEKPEPISTSGPMVVPTGATTGGALVSGKADAPVRLEVYLDYMCPYCGQFERANGEEIARLVGAGTVRLETYPLAFLDEASSGTQYSTRAANAAATVSDRAADKFIAFNNSLFAHQPAEGGEGLTDDAIASLARDAGVPAEVTDAFGDRTFVPWVADSTKKAFAGGLQGTPTVKIDGVQFTGDLYKAGPLTEAINQAAK